MSESVGDNISECLGDFVGISTYAVRWRRGASCRNTMRSKRRADRCSQCHKGTINPIKAGSRKNRRATNAPIAAKINANRRAISSAVVGVSLARGEGCMIVLLPFYITFCKQIHRPGFGNDVRRVSLGPRPSRWVSRAPPPGRPAGRDTSAAGPRRRTRQTPRPSPAAPDAGCRTRPDWPPAPATG